MAAIYLSVFAAATMSVSEEPIRAAAPPPPPPIISIELPRRPEGPNLPPTPRYGLSTVPAYSDRPKMAGADTRQGVTEVELAVSKWGRVADCRILSSSGHADLDAAACNAFAVRGQFWPATDPSGNDAAGTWRQKMDWGSAAPPPVRVAPTVPSLPIIGKSEYFPRPPVATKYAWARIVEPDWPEGAKAAGKGGTATVSFSVDREGETSDCEVVDSSGHSDLDARSCTIVSERADFRPAIGTDGLPTEGRVRQALIWNPATPTGATRTSGIPTTARGPIKLPALLTEAGTARLDIETGKDGKAVRCETKGDKSLNAVQIMLAAMCVQAREREFVPASGTGPLPKQISLEVRIDTVPAKP